MNIIQPILRIFFLTAVSFSAMSQNANNTGSLSDGVRIERSEFEGTAFYTKKWLSGYAIYENGNKTNTFPLNYELNQDKLIYQPTEGKTLELLDSDFVGFIINSPEGAILFTKTNRFEYSDGKIPKMSYVRVYNPSSPSILIEYYKEIDDPNRSGWTSSSNNTLNAKYEEKSNVYIKNPSGKFEKIKLKAKSILDVYDADPELKEYLKTNKIKDLDDLVKVMAFVKSNSK